MRPTLVTITVNVATWYTDINGDCQPGYTGINCETETDINECTPNPCVNNGLCHKEANVYTCICNAGYAGRLCDQQIDECNSNPCENNGSCTDDIGGYNCTCLPRFTGM